LVKLKAITINKTAAYKLLGIQLVISVGVALLLLVYSGRVSAWSALMGGLIFILPNAYFTRSAFRGNERESPGFIVRWFFIGEAGKLVLTAVMFALCFVWVEFLQVKILFTMYIVMIIINMAGLSLCRNERQENSG
jgi:ATP synthase protein I